MNKRISELSCDQKAFAEASPSYQEALNSSGFHHKLEFQADNHTHIRSKRSRKRNITWFNPPYSKTVKTNVGKAFLNLLDKHFPPEHRLRKIFNRNTVKMSYSCMKNMKSIIQTHNSQIINKETKAVQDFGCNCRIKTSCPLDGKCLTPAVIYKAEVTSTDSTQTYIGMAGGPFKERYNNHKKSFNLKRHEKETALSRHIWALKQDGAVFSIRWKILAQSNTQKGASGLCNLCQAEKLAIINHNSPYLLNKRSEIISQCRHGKTRKKTSQADKG